MEQYRGKYTLLTLNFLLQNEIHGQQTHLEETKTAERRKTFKLKILIVPVSLELLTALS